MALLPIRIDGTKAIVDLKALQQELQKTADSGEKAAVSTGRYDDALDKQGDQAKKTARDTDRVGKETKQAGDKAKRAATETAVFNKALGQTRRFAIGARTALIGLVAAGGLTLGLRGAVSTLGDYSEKMAVLGFVTRASAEDLAALEKQNKDLGASTRFSASQAAEAQTMLARAGFDVQQVMAATPATLQLATIAQMGLGESADLASNLVSQFNLAAEQTPEVVNAIVVVSNRANTNIQQLGEAMKFAGPVASAMNVDLAETAAVMGVLGDSGIQASLAGTNVRGMLAGLLQPSESAEAALANLGLTTESVRVENEGLIGVFEKLVARGAGVEEFLAIFGRRNVAAASALALATSKARFLQEEIANVSDEGERGEQAIGDNLNGALASFASTAEAATLKTGENGLGGALSFVIETGRDTIKILFGLGQEIGDVDTASQALVITLGAVGGALLAITAAKVIGGLYAIAGALIGLSTALSPVTAGLIALGVVGGGIAASFLVANDEFQRTNEELQTMRANAAAMDPAFKGVEDAVLRVDKAYKQIFDFDGPPRLLTGDDAASIAAARTGSVNALQSLRDAFSEQSLAGSTTADQRDQVLNSAGTVLGDDFARSFFRDSNRTLRESGIPSDGRRDTAALFTLDKALERARAQEADAKAVAQGIRLEEQRAQIDEARIARTQELTAALEQELAIENERSRIMATGNDAELERFEFFNQNAEAAELLGDKYHELADAILAARRRQQELESSSGGGSNRIASYLQDLEFERGQFGRSPASQEIRLARFRAMQEGATVGELEQIESMISEIQTLRDLESVADGIGNAFASSFERAVFEAESLRDVVRALGEDILRIIFRQTIAQPIANGISGLLQGLGGAIFGGGGGGGEGASLPPDSFRVTNNALGNIVNFANGGIPEYIDRSTAFPMSGNRIGRAGEGGDEVAIAPLARTKSGRLGVEVAGGGGGSMTVIQNNTFNGVASDRDANISAARMRRAVRSAGAFPRGN